jgi:hypothetical protein
MRAPAMEQNSSCNMSWLPYTSTFIYVFRNTAYMKVRDCTYICDTTVSFPLVPVSRHRYLNITDTINHIIQQIPQLPNHNAIHILYLTPQFPQCYSYYTPHTTVLFTTTLSPLYIRYHNILTTMLLALYIKYHRSTISTALKLYITTMLFTLYIGHHSSHSAVCIYTQHHRLVRYDAIHIIHQIPQYHNLKAIHTNIWHHSILITPCKSAQLL